MSSPRANRQGSVDLPRSLVAEDLVIVLADLQPQIVERSRSNPQPSLRRASGILVEGASAFGIPILRSVIRLGPGTVPEAIEELAGEPPVIRSTVGVLDHEESRDALAAHDRSTIAIGGVSSEVAVLHSVLGARRLGYAVHVLVDVCGSPDARTEQAAFRQMEAAGATLSSVPSLLTSLAPDLHSPDFGVVIGLLSRLWAE